MALELLFLDELIPSGTECEFVDGLKSHHAPRFVSSHILLRCLPPCQTRKNLMVSN